jgi:membrane protein implicated in regulation of membrane protease activity
MTIIWLGAFIVFIFIEVATIGLTSVWFALGSLAALLFAVLGAQLWLQIVVFIVVTAITLYFTRPAAQKFLNSRRKATNADRVLSMVGIVKEDIDNISAKGQVAVGGKDWTARSLTGEPLPAGTLVRPIRIEGVKLIVEKTGVSEPADAPDNSVKQPYTVN